MEHTDQFVRATVCERRNEDARAYKILMNVAGDSREFAILPMEMRKVGRQLATCLAAVAEPDYVVGFAPGGIPSAMALAIEVNLPMIVAYKCQLGLPGEIVWEEPHCVNSTFYLYGLSGGMRVVLVDDEVDSGATICNAVRALRAAGIEVVAVAVAAEALHGGYSRGRARLDELGLALHCVGSVEVEHGPSTKDPAHQGKR
jgi:adenine/guanine phosphoribosyltransferase-like PRPP-binding protein